MYSGSLEHALRIAMIAHAGQTRRGDHTIPYATHPIHVCLLLARLGHDDEILQAGLLHDVVEDCAEWTVARIEREFSRRVAGFVAELTEDKSRSWEERKRQAIESAPSLSEGAAVIKACDKLHNLASLVNDLERAGDPAKVWSKFTGGPARTLAMSRQLVDALAPRIRPELSASLQALVVRLEAIVSR
jgi:(p)ppGpp synthase/HD superfamily hydrolase